MWSVAEPFAIVDPLLGDEEKHMCRKIDIRRIDVRRMGEKNEKSSVGGNDGSVPALEPDGLC